MNAIVKQTGNRYLPAAVSAGVPKQRLEFAYDYQGRRI